MASPLGHALAGYAIGRSSASEARLDVRLLATCAVLAVAPDLDFLPGVLEGRPAAYHQSISHSLVVAGAAGALGALSLGRSRAVFGRNWLICFAAYASHLALDWLGQDARPPIGIPLFWPFSDAAWLSPVALLPGIDHAARSDVSNTEWLGSIFSLHNVYALAVELAVAVPLLAFAELRLRRLAGTTR